jgi:DnaA family protein
MQPTQLPLGIRLRDSSVFASFYAGRNKPLIDALLSLPEGEPPRCVWLHGPDKTGKTHLLQAICAHAGERNLTAAYLPLREPQISPDMLAGCGQIAHVCIDDAHLVAGDAKWERALFSLYQELEEHRGRLWVSGTSAPAALAFGLRDLASRLNGGLVLTLQPLSEAEQIEALKLRAELRGFELPEETAQFLLRRLPRDMGSLCEFLDELDRASLAAQRRLTVRFVSEVWKETRGD